MKVTINIYRYNQIEYINLNELDTLKKEYDSIVCAHDEDINDVMGSTLSEETKIRALFKLYKDKQKIREYLHEMSFVTDMIYESYMWRSKSMIPFIKPKYSNAIVETPSGCYLSLMVEYYGKGITRYDVANLNYLLDLMEDNACFEFKLILLEYMPEPQRRTKLFTKLIKLLFKRS